MPVRILMPKLGLTMKEALLLEWRKKVGEKVQRGEVLYLLETEKVTHEVDAAEDGILGAILVNEGETVRVGTVVAYLLKPGDDVSSLPDPTSATPATREPEEYAVNTSTCLDAKSEGSVPTRSARPRATPYARKLAREMGLDLARITGSGSLGRIRSQDLPEAAPADPASQAGPDRADRLVPFSGMRAAIAQRMMQSKLESAQAYMSNTVDASNLVAYRMELLPYVERKFRTRLTYTDLLMKITAEAIMEHPVINTRWTTKGVLFLPSVHMGMAMALDDGLIVPVIRDINAKRLGGIARERVELIKRGKEKRFLPDDITGSTFTLSAMGMFGIESFSAILNPPESAILAVGAIRKMVVPGEKSPEIKPMLNLTLTYDHRVIDGAEAGKFMQTLSDYVEQMVKILV